MLLWRSCECVILSITASVWTLETSCACHVEHNIAAQWHADPSDTSVCYLLLIMESVVLSLQVHVWVAAPWHKGFCTTGDRTNG